MAKQMDLTEFVEKGYADKANRELAKDGLQLVFEKYACDYEPAKPADNVPGKDDRMIPGKPLTYKTRFIGVKVLHPKKTVVKPEPVEKK